MRSELWDCGMAVNFKRRFHFGTREVEQSFACDRDSGRIRSGMDELTLDHYLDAYPPLKQGVLLHDGHFYEVPPPPGILKPFELWTKAAHSNFLLCLTKIA